MQGNAHSLVPHDHVRLLGVDVSAINMKRAVELAGACIESRGPGYVCVTGVHGVMEAQRDPAFLSILNSSTLNVPDGMPLSRIGRLRGFKSMDRVYGPDFVLELCEYSVKRGYRHFFYGGNEGVAPLVGAALQKRFPGLQIAGTYTPPFRPLNQAEETELMELLKATQPDVLWVGLSTPKQERFMSAYVQRLEVPLLVGVGAAFDIHAGRLQDAPNWMKRSSLQWLYRLVQEPRRLGRRYLVNNPLFLWRMAGELLFGSAAKVKERRP